MALPLTDDQRRLIHDLALDARELLAREARELLEGVYGLYADGQLDPPDKLPQVAADPEATETHRRLAGFVDDEARAGIPRTEAVEKLAKEVAFTHLNRLVAFKMMEARRLIRGTLDKGTDSNGFKFYLADPEHSADLVRYEHGESDQAYRHFLLWQAGQVARELRVLFDPDSLPSRLFPRPRALGKLIEMLNRPELAPLWQADETIGWLYQFFNEREKAEVFDRLYNAKQKLRRQDIPAATQLFTPNWIVRFLVQNTLGRLWVEMHPDTRLLRTDVLDYLVPLADDAAASEPKKRKAKPVKEITFLDPACGGMHFGLVAFDLFAIMYEEELARAGEPGWSKVPSVAEAAAIPAAILEHNIFGIDIDLRAVQLSALALYLKAKSLNPKAQITGSNLACADVLPLNGARLGAFLREARFTRPVYERLIRALWERLRDVSQVGSLLRLEREMGALIAQERARYAETPLFAGMPGEFEHEAAEAEFWDLISGQIVQALDEFARQQAAAGADQTFFTGEAVKGLRLVELMLREYDVVVTNPPYSGRRNLNDLLGEYLEKEYPDAKGDLYAAFIQRCGELVARGGRLGMITQQSFMFLSSYEKLRGRLRERFAIDAMAHVGARAFAEISGEKVNTTVFTLRAEEHAAQRNKAQGTYMRLVKAGEGDAKRQALKRGLATGENMYRVRQERFDAIPGKPWVYWVSDGIRALFQILPALRQIAPPRQGLATSDNNRFVRFWWEVGLQSIGQRCRDRVDAAKSERRWFPYAKGGINRRWYGNQEHVVNWWRDGEAIKEEILHRYPYLDGNWEWVAKNASYYFLEGVTFNRFANTRIAMRWLPSGCVFDCNGPVISQSTNDILAIANAAAFSQLCSLINPGVNFQVGDVEKAPVPLAVPKSLVALAHRCVREARARQSPYETIFDFAGPACWGTGTMDQAAAEVRLTALESQIDDEVYRLYGISDADRAAIEAELAGGPAVESDDEKGGADEDGPHEESADEPTGAMSREELAVRWISYAVGIVLGRFRPGVPGALGSATYRRDDFAIGSLPAPDEAEFDELVGPPERFAYVDAEGGRHLFNPEVEANLRDLALPDGIAVLDEGHPRDLPTLVERVLGLMLGEGESQIIDQIGGDLRAFLSKDFFTRWHLRWYRKRPVYWPMQSGRRSYGFVLFHERADRLTLYTLQRDYLDYKLNAVRQQVTDLNQAAAMQTGATRRASEREAAKTAALLDELTEFARTLERIVRGGYEPEPDWIDDGVILRLAPLWELLPLWKAEPKKYWERLARGDFDWSHIAVKYWPDRVREKCKTNKSFAIAHGHEEWYGEH